MENGMNSVNSVYIEISNQIWILDMFSFPSNSILKCFFSLQDPRSVWR